MKTIIVILFLGSISTFGQFSGGYAFGNDAAKNGASAADVAEYKQREIYFVPRDPWRIINGTTNFAKGNDWYQFEGKILEVQPEGIRVSGLYSVPGGYVMSYASIYQEKEFFVKHFPYRVAEDDVIRVDGKYTAKISDNYTYPTAIGGSRTIHCLDYGFIWTPPPVTAIKKVTQTNSIASKTNSVH